MSFSISLRICGEQQAVVASGLRGHGSTWILISKGLDPVLLFGRSWALDFDLGGTSPSKVQTLDFDSGEAGSWILIRKEPVPPRSRP